MSVLPRRQFGWLIATGLAVVAAAVTGALLLTSSRAGEVDLTTAELVPADAGVYIAINTDLASAQWINAFALIERLGQEDPEGQVRDSAEDEGLDWEEDVAPFLGGNAAFYLGSLDLEAGMAQGAFVLEADDAERAERVVIRESDLDFDTDSYRDVEYRAAADGSLYLLRADGHLVLTPDEESLLAVIDVHTGNAPSLASEGRFAQLRDELTANFLAFWYVDADLLAGDLLDDALREAVAGSELDGLAFEPMAAVIGATEDAFELQTASLAEAGPAAAALAPRTSRFAAMVPADTLFFASTYDVASVWEASVEAMRNELDELAAESGEYRDLEDALAAAGEPFGLASIEELVRLFEGESAIAYWSPSADEDDAEVIFLAEVSDERAVEEAIESANASDEGSFTREIEINGITVTVIEDGSDEPGAYAIDDGVLYLGTAGAVRIVLEGGHPPLAGLDTYTRATAQLGTSLGTYAYFDLGRLLRLADGAIPAELDEAERALDALIINYVVERGVTRAGGVITVKGDD